MLVLTRREGEKIVIDRNVTLEVLEVHPERVVLGVVAPKEVPIHRGEVCTDRRPESLNKTPHTKG